jgi:hypothetical protein
MSRKTKAALVGAMALAACLAAFVGQADAAVYTATYTGQVAEVDIGGNYTGFFDGSDVAAGKAFTAVFRWDEADAAPGSADAPPLYSLYSGLLTATVTVGTSSFDFQAPNGSVVAVHDVAGASSTILHYIDTIYAPGLRYAVQFYTQGGADLLSSWDWRTTGTFDLTGANATGAFVYQNLAGPGGGADLAGAVLTPTKLVVARDGGAGGVPEPAAWALMILGFGGAGVMLRRRAGLAANADAARA